MISFEMRGDHVIDPRCGRARDRPRRVAVRAGTQRTMPLHQCLGTTATGTARLRSTIPGTMWIGLRQRCARPRVVNMTNVPAIGPGMTVTFAPQKPSRGASGARRSHHPHDDLSTVPQAFPGQRCATAARKSVEGRLGGTHLKSKPSVTADSAILCHGP
jgi:hypothetical protein